VYQEQVIEIFRSLAGYTMGQADNIRRAISKKKQKVIEEERKVFVYGDAQQGIPGCIARGVTEQAAQSIYDEIVDFANYAFNKAHAVCYAVVSYQTAYLKYYYPVEFMAALLTSVIDNSKKVSEYILTCRNMGIELLPPDINQGEAGFSVSDGSIRYALTAIKSVGRPVIEAVVEERNVRGPFTNLKDFITRMSEKDKDVNKRAIENFIKAGVFDSFGGTRKQFMTVYVSIMDHIHQDKKNNMAGQMSLFDFASEEAKEDFDVKMPDVGEYEKEKMLTFEKEVLGIYVSGHPMEEYEAIWRRKITNTTSDFYLDEETGTTKVEDGKEAVVGGIIADKKIKYTKNDKVMAFLNLEDLVGNIEVIVFPKDYEKNAAKIKEENKVFVKGKVSVEEDRDAKLICQNIMSFDEIPKKLWIQFQTKEEYLAVNEELMNILKESDGKDTVVIYIKGTNEKKVLPPNMSVLAENALIEILSEKFGQENVKVTV
jgi:DNA polymerase-3 subunit alpha